MRIKRLDRRRIFRMFAVGKTPKQVVEELTEVTSKEERHSASNLERIEELYERYLRLPLDEKQRITLMPDHVTDRRHRLMDDIMDLTRVEALLADADMKTLPSLLDIKRKIKERMAKESASAFENRSEEIGNDSEGYIDEAINRIG